MASELDRQLQTILERIVAPKSLFERETIVRDNHSLTVFRNAPENLTALFAQGCADHADREFLVDGDVRLTFGEVYDLARRTATGLIVRHNVRPGDRVGIAARNSASWVVAYMGVLMAGGCAVLLNGWWVGRELAHGVTLAECALVLADDERARRLADLDMAVPVITFDHGHPATGLSAVLAPLPGQPGEAAALPQPAPDDPATILFTSGSTGLAKAAWSDHRAVTQAAASFAAQSQIMSVQAAEAGAPLAAVQTALLCVPLFHVTGKIALLLPSFLMGRRVVILPRWNAAEAMRLIARERVTMFVGVPLMSFEVATHPQRSDYDLSSCKAFAAGGAPRPIRHVGAIRAALPDAFPVMGYGLTETNCVGCTNINENYLAKPWSTGPVSSPLVELAIFDDAGNALPAGAPGEVAIRSVCNIRGYWNDPEATRQTLRADGFLLTGDIGYLDTEGYLVVVDRKKDIIIRGGENISCSEVEEAIYAHPDIAEVCVIGMDHHHHGEVPVAIYTPRDGAELSEQDLRHHLVGRLASFKHPVTFWREMQPLPRLGTQKIDKVKLKARYSQMWEAARTAA